MPVVTASIAAGLLYRVFAEIFDSVRGILAVLDAGGRCTRSGQRDLVAGGITVPRGRAFIALGMALFSTRR